VRAVERPSVSEALNLVQEGLRQGRVVLLVGRCSVDYVGRASSRLGLGDRVVIYKPDGSILVHRPEGYEPVNWMPAGSYLTASSSEGRLNLRAVRRRPFEELKVSFMELYLAAAGRLIDEEELMLHASEEEMRRAVRLKPCLVEPGLKLHDEERHLQLAGGEGSADLVGEDAEGNLAVLELKRRRVDEEAVVQLKRYVDSLKARTPRRVRGILVAPSITRRALRLAQAFNLSFRRLDPKECSRVLREAEVEAKPLEAYEQP